MFSNDKNIETITKMLADAKHYGNLRLESFERSTVEKLSTIITGLIMGVVVFVVSLIVVVFLSAAIVVAIAPHVGGYLPAFLIVGGFYAIVLIVLYAKRHSLIAIPIKSALATIFFAERAEEAAPTAQQMQEARQTLADDYESLTAPPPPASNKIEHAMRLAGKAWTMADLFISAYKLYTKFSPSRRKKRRF